MRAVKEAVTAGAGGCAGGCGVTGTQNFLCLFQSYNRMSTTFEDRDWERTLHSGGVLGCNTRQIGSDCTSLRLECSKLCKGG